MIQSLQRALNIMNCVAAARGWIGVREIARSTGLKVTTAQQLLKTLQAENYLDFDESSRRYRIGLAALMLSEGNDITRVLNELVEPYMQKLLDESSETVAALALHKNRVVVVNWKQSPNLLAVVHPRDYFVEHPHLMASGLALLAFLPEEQRTQYAGSQLLGTFKGATPRNSKELLILLEKVAADGFAVTENVVDSGVTAVGVPVFGKDGKILLSLGCSAPSIRMPHEKIESVKGLLIKTASELEKKIQGESK